MTKRILVVGATGFVASQIVAECVKAGHTVVACARDVAFARRKYPFADCIPCNFNRDTNSKVWIERLKAHRIDVVINCVGVFQGGLFQRIRSIHTAAPIALFKACQILHLKGIIQVSALGAGEIDTPYASTKAQADDFLLNQSEVPYLIIRPSVILSSGAYGGSALFRGLASLPFIIPVVGKGQQKMAPIYLPELAHALIDIVTNDQYPNKVLNATGPETITQSDLLKALRSWLGFQPAFVIPVPLPFIKLGAIFGNLVQSSPLNTTAIKMLEKDNVADGSDFYQQLSFPIRGVTQVLQTLPSSTQDRWHARLYFIRPILTILVAVIWAAIAILCLSMVQG